MLPPACPACKPALKRTGITGRFARDAGRIVLSRRSASGRPLPAHLERERQNPPTAYCGGVVVHSIENQYVFRSNGAGRLHG